MSSSNARLFVFAIGGTGSRVLKSLIMLLASGVQSRYKFEIVPIIIDPHQSNEDLKQTVALLHMYEKIRKEANNPKHGFFSTPFATLGQFASGEDHALTSSFSFNLEEVASVRFKEYIDYNGLDEANRALADILFSGTSVNIHGDSVPLLDVEMDIGFVGNPNIGSIVLNQIKSSKEFKAFANTFTDKDRIFIISSIFGGTGAAGFPILLKNIRGAQDNEDINSRGFLKNAAIGALSVMPYFNIESDTADGAKSPIQKSDFISKTKSALSYYKDNVNEAVNALYYLADDESGSNAYKNDPGYGGQKNDAHFIELLGALSVIDFMSMDDESLRCENGTPRDAMYKEFAIKENTACIHFHHLYDETEAQIALRLSQFLLCQKYFTERLAQAVEKQAWTRDEPKIDRTFLGTTFYRSNLLTFLNTYKTWLEEMAQNTRSFAPFNLHAENLDTLIEGRKVKKGMFSKSVSYDSMDSLLSSGTKKEKFATQAEKLLSIFFNLTEKILVDKFAMTKPS